MATPLWGRSQWPLLLQWQHPAQLRSHPTCPAPRPASPARWDSKLVFLTPGVVTLSLNPSSLCQQGFLVQFIREIPESTDHAGSPPFLVSSIITFTVNMSLSSGWAGDGWSMLLPSGPVYIDRGTFRSIYCSRTLLHRLVSVRLETSHLFFLLILSDLFSDKKCIIVNEYLKYIYI